MQLEIVTHAKANRARCPYLNNPTTLRAPNPQSTERISVAAL